MQLNGSQIFVEVLCEQGVDTLFGYPGGAVLNLYDELYKNADRITHVLTAHEQGAAHAAEAVIQFVRQLSGSVGIPAALSQLNKVDPADFGTLADLALHDTCMTTNQITPTRQEVIAVYTAAFRG